MKRIFVATVGFLSVVGCTGMSETTATSGGVTGGVVGAGLGAIIGSTTGNAGAGVAIGAAAGAATGAVIGKKIETQNEMLRTQDEAIERQDQMITAHKREIEELKRLSGDSVSFRGNPVSQSIDPDRYASMKRAAMYGEKPPSHQQALSDQAKGRGFGMKGDTYVPQPAYSSSRTSLTSRTTTPAPSKISESSLVEIEQGAPVPVRGTLRWGEDDAVQPKSSVKPTSSVEEVVAGLKAESEMIEQSVKDDQVETEQASAEVVDQLIEEEQSESAKVVTSAESEISAECKQAADEVNQAKLSEEASDKLFHYRRALRLCPENAENHNGLGEVYLSLGRKVDAEFEFQQALKVDPTFLAAKENLSKVQ